jgi:hypothetical protein
VDRLAELMTASSCAVSGPASTRSRICARLWPCCAAENRGGGDPRAHAKIVEERGLKLAMEPKVTILNEARQRSSAIGGETDLRFTLSLEVLPKIELGDSVPARAPDDRSDRCRGR